MSNDISIFFIQVNGLSVLLKICLTYNQTPPSVHKRFSASSDRRILPKNFYARYQHARHGLLACEI